MSETTEPKPIPGAADQTYLVGASLYLRGLELPDAKRASAWRASPFPIPAERAEELLKKEVPEERKQRSFRFVACRRADDAPVGSAVYHSWDWRTAWVDLWADPAFGAAAPAIKAEVLGLLVPWLHHEREMMAVWVAFDAAEAAVRSAAEALGMRPAVCLREAVWRDGARRDHLTYEGLHPAWVRRLGDPGPGIAHAVPPEDPGRRRPGPPRPVTVEPDGDPPRNAVMIGERVFLRPVEVEDSAEAGAWSRRETETFFDDGRQPISSLRIAHWHRKLAEDDPPSWVRFAVCLRESGEYIGSNGIADIDWVHKTAETESFFHRPDFRGSGYGTEAKHLLLAYAFERLGLHQVRSFVWGPNTRSAAALRKQGYRDAGRLHWSGFKDAEYTHDGAFDLLASEWREMQGR